MKLNLSKLVSLGMSECTFSQTNPVGINYQIIKIKPFETYLNIIFLDGNE